MQTRCPLKYAGPGAVSNAIGYAEHCSRPNDAVICVYDEEGCQIYHWSQGADDPTLFLLYMEWRDKACFEAHIATPHVKHAEDRLKRDKMLIEPAKEWHFYRL